MLPGVARDTVNGDVTLSSPGQVYANKSLLWLTCPLLLYWITRLWFLAKRAELHEDPVVFAVTDKVSLGVGAAVGILVLLAGLPVW